VRLAEIVHAEGGAKKVGRVSPMRRHFREESRMFVVTLRFSANKAKAGHLMEGHKEWIKRGFDDGVFLLVGNLQPNLGGGIVAHNTSLPDLQGRVSADPFVLEDVVSAEILEITPSRADERLNGILA
jgi:uncharacterized protein YciI